VCVARPAASGMGTGTERLKPKGQLPRVRTWAQGRRCRSMSIREAPLASSCAGVCSSGAVGRRLVPGRLGAGAGGPLRARAVAAEAAFSPPLRSTRTSGALTEICAGWGKRNAPQAKNSRAHTHQHSRRETRAASIFPMREPAATTTANAGRLCRLRRRQTAGPQPARCAPHSQRGGRKLARPSAEAARSTGR